MDAQRNVDVYKRQALPYLRVALVTGTLFSLLVP